MAKAVILDTSAILSFVDDEDGADTVCGHLRSAEAGRSRVIASFVSLTECRYITLQEQGESAADYLIGLLKDWPLEWIHSDEPICLLAAHYKAEHHLSLADAFVAATARIHGAILVHKDPEFEPLGKELSLFALPYKSAR